MNGTPLFVLSLALLGLGWYVLFPGPDTRTWGTRLKTHSYQCMVRFSQRIHLIRLVFDSKQLLQFSVSYSVSGRL